MIEESVASGGRTTILVVDDEPQIHRFLKPVLEAAGYTVARADTAALALRSVASRAPDLVLLDLGLPDLDGQEALRQLRGFSTVPVIVLSARDREAEKIAALDSGADDYLEKPFGLGELLARIRTALRHRLAQAGVQEVFRSGNLTVDMVRRLVLLDGERIPLSVREYTLLALLVANAGKVMTHRHLLTSVWGSAHAADVQYLRVYVGQLRQKLAAAGPSLIETEPGVGYRFTAEAEPAGDVTRSA